MKKTLNRECAQSVINIFLEKCFKDIDTKNAVLTVIENTTPEAQIDVSTETVQNCLFYFKKNKTERMEILGIYFLVLALSIADKFPISKNTAESLVCSVAEAGFIGRFPELPKRLLSRDMNENEVVALVTSYINRHAVRCEDHEKKYIDWIKKYLPQEKASKQIERINQFIRRWESSIDDF